MDAGFLDVQTFSCIIEHTPIVSVDLIVMNEDRVLLGKRVNKPAQGYWFTLGGRVRKHERIRDALNRIARDELGSIPDTQPEFVGVFEHLYDDGIFEQVSTHYLNLGYRIEVDNLNDLPEQQHNAYRWFEIEELLNSDLVHSYVKDYFTIEKGTIPQIKEWKWPRKLR